MGEHNAVMAGLNRVTGDYIVIMDDDFQNPISEVVKLVDKALEDVLSGGHRSACFYNEESQKKYKKGRVKK